MVLASTLPPILPLQLMLDAVNGTMESVSNVLKIMLSIQREFALRFLTNVKLLKA